MDKIRDLRNKFFQINDEFLNGYAKLCGINATGVYLSMCRHASKQQTCFPSKKLIAEELAISERSVYTAIKKLAEWHIIKIERQGRKTDGSFKNLLYTLLDKTEWKDKPSANSAVGKKQHSPSANDDITRRQQVPNKETHINYTHNKETHIVSKADEEFNLLEENKKLLSDKQRHIQIIGIWLKAKSPNIENKKQLQSFIKRNLRPAKLLDGYKNDRIIEVIKWLKENADFKITLESVSKYIDENLEKLNSNDLLVIK